MSQTLPPAVHWLFLFIRARLSLLLVASILVSSLTLSGCANRTIAYTPSGDAAVINLDRTQSLSDKNVTVQVSIPTDVEASALFGVPLAQHNIQPIKIRIENRSQVDYWLMPIAIDPDYYSADEAALLTGTNLSREESELNRRRFRALALPFFTPAESTQEGYVCASHKIGGALCRCSTFRTP